MDLSREPVPKKQPLLNCVRVCAVSQWDVDSYKVHVCRHYFQAAFLLHQLTFTCPLTSSPDILSIINVVHSSSFMEVAWYLQQQHVNQDRNIPDLPESFYIFFVSVELCFVSTSLRACVCTFYYYALCDLSAFSYSGGDMAVLIFSPVAHDKHSSCEL